MSALRTLGSAWLVLALVSVGSAQTKPAAPFDLKQFEPFAKQIEKNVRENKQEAFANLLDLTAMQDAVFAEVKNASPGFKIGFSQGLSMLGQRVFGEWAKSVAGGGDFSFLRMREANGQPRALFRVVGGNGLNYVDLILAREGKPRVLDIYSNAGGETVLQSTTRMAKLAVAAEAGAPSEFLEVGKQMQQVVELVSKNQPQEALNEYQRLPEKYQAEKNMQLMHVVIRAKFAQQDPDASIAAIERYLKLFPNDPSGDLISLDSYFLRMKYQDGLKAIDRIDQAMGGDPYLGVMRSYFHTKDGDLASARKHAELAAKGAPQVRQAELAIADVCLLQNDFPRLAQSLTTLESKFKMDFSGVATAEPFAKFRESPQYAQWRAARGK